jgi:hypothetical protein
MFVNANNNSANNTNPNKVINYDTFDFKNSTVIEPKSNKYTESTSNKSYIVSSAERDLDLYPSQSSYVVPMIQDFTDVLSFSLLVHRMPFNPYNVTSYNNKIALEYNSIPYEITIPIGKYDSTALTTTIQTALRLVTGDNTWTVTFDTVSLHFRFTVSTGSSFKLCNSELINGKTTYLSNSILKRMGFSCGLFTSVNGSLESCFAADIFDDNDTIVMYIDTMQVNMGDASSIFNRSYAVLHKQMYESNIRVIKKTFNPPQARLARIRLSFYDMYGNTYDFQNRDHVIEFNIELFKMQRRYMTPFMED